MISDAEAFCILSRFKYKPNWEFKVETVPGVVSLLIRVKCEMPDSKGQLVILCKELNFRPSGYHTGSHFLTALFRWIEDIEIELCRAWLKEANQ